MIVAIIDTETTGIGEGHKLIELATGRLDTDDPKARPIFWQARFNPGREIPPDASAVHHITNLDVAHLDLFEEKDWLDATCSADVLCAHNADFDRGFLPKDDRPWIDTYRCAVKTWPNAPSHSNQSLRYFLEINVDTLGMNTHGALPDIIVTIGILKKLLEKHSVEDLIAISGEPVLLPIIRFSKHKGKRWSEVPVDFLRWVLAPKPDPFSEDVLYTARYWLEEGNRERSRLGQ